MRARSRAVHARPMWADWFLELEELLERRESTRDRSQRLCLRRSPRSIRGRAGG